jgi:hypothetical protein
MILWIRICIESIRIHNPGFNHSMILNIESVDNLFIIKYGKKRSLKG